MTDTATQTPGNGSAVAPSLLNVELDGFLLPAPPRGRLAEQCRYMGIGVGDTIQSTELLAYRVEGWEERRLTLLWLGTEQAVFMVRRRTDLQPEWSDPKEESNWTLDCRRWAKVSNADVTGLAPREDDK